MQTQTSANHFGTSGHLQNILTADEIAKAIESGAGEFKNFFHQLLIKLATTAGKKSFLIFKNNKYVNVLTENIAYFHVRYESSMITCFDKQEYFVNYSLEQIQNLLPEKQFFRLNRQYLINFNAIREVEHYFARKLLVNPSIPAKDKLIVSKEKVTEFLQWLDNR
jgi:two-component system, LytTR family, response regulator LytT